MGRCPGMGYWLALSAAIGLSALYVWHQDLPGRYKGYQRSEQEVRELRNEWRAHQERREALEERIRGLEHDPVELEAAIRRSRRMVREGETVYRVELPGESEEE
ncbi:MAG: FtsB family cell division protein [Candidatus Hydrogenedentota bacterium]